jgi:hypothetical protein
VCVQHDSPVVFEGWICTTRLPEERVTVSGTSVGVFGTKHKVHHSTWLSLSGVVCLCSWSIQIGIQDMHIYAVTMAESHSLNPDYVEGQTRLVPWWVKLKAGEKLRRVT